MAQIWKAAPVVEALAEETDRLVAQVTAQGITPQLAIVRVGNRPDDISYERGACKRCEARGIAATTFELAAESTQDELMTTIQHINDDPAIHGCLMLRPLPASLNEEAATAVLLPQKDIDGITPPSLFGVFAQETVGFAPCTAQAVIEVLDHYGAHLDGANVCVIGRSLVVGRPVSLMLQKRNATVTMCHSHTRTIQQVCRQADIVVAAIGQAHTIDVDWVSPGQVVIDVGINWDSAASKLVGDVDFDSVEPKVAAITPVPGGLGAVTSAVLCKHLAQAAVNQLAAPPYQESNS